MNVDFIIFLIIGLTALISYRAFSNDELFNKMKFNAVKIWHNKQYYRIISHGLVHVDLVHLAVNMFVFWSFGKIVLGTFNYIFGTLGTLVFIGFYASAIAISSLSSLFKHKNNIYYNSVGASGAVNAIVFSSIILYPEGSLYLFLIPVPIPSWLFGVFYLVYSAYMSKKQVDNIGHDAHFWGAIYGLLFVLLFVQNSFSNFLYYFIG